VVAQNIVGHNFQLSTNPQEVDLAVWLATSIEVA